MEKPPKRQRLSPGSQTSKEETKDEGSGEETKEKKGESSPARCPICLTPPENAAKSDSCSHYFCFSCLKKWSKRTAECPLCKMPIRSIVYDIRSDSQYGEYKVKDPRPRDSGDDDALGPSAIQSEAEVTRRTTSVTSSSGGYSDDDEMSRSSHESAATMTRRKPSVAPSPGDCPATPPLSLSPHLSLSLIDSSDDDGMSSHTHYIPERLDWAPLRQCTSGWDSSPDGSENPGGPSMQSLMLSQTSLGSDDSFPEPSTFDPSYRSTTGFHPPRPRDEHVNRNAGLMRHPEPPVPTSHQEHTEVIVISSDSEDEALDVTAHSSRPGSKTLHYHPRSDPSRDGASGPKRIKTERPTYSPSDSDEAAVSSAGSDVEVVKYVKPVHLRTPDAFIDLSSGEDDAPGPSGIHSEAIMTRRKLSVTSSPSDSSDDDGRSRSYRRRSSHESASSSRHNALHRRQKFPERAHGSYRRSSRHESASSSRQNVLHSTRSSHGSASTSRHDALLRRQKFPERARKGYRRRSSHGSASTSRHDALHRRQKFPERAHKGYQRRSSHGSASTSRHDALHRRQKFPERAHKGYRRRSSHGSASSSRHDALHRIKKSLERARRDARRRESSNEEGEVNVVMGPSSNDKVISAAVLMNNRTLPSVIVMSRSDAVMSQSEPVTAHVLALLHHEVIPKVNRV